MDLLPVGETPAKLCSSRISAFKPNVSRDEAIVLLKRAGMRKWSWIRRSSPLRSVAEFYVPFQVFCATIVHRSAREERFMAVDLLSGALDPFTFLHPPERNELMEMETRNFAEPVLSRTAAEQALRTKLQRLLFQFGFFRVGNLRIDVEPLEQVYMPYWLGFFGAGDRAALEVLDATRRVREGARLRRMTQDWIVRSHAAIREASFTKSFS